MYEHIEILLDKFFTGETSNAEERELQDFFASTATLPESLQPYRAMFAWYAAGMPEEALAGNARPKRFRWFHLPSAVAASVAVLVAVALFMFISDYTPASSDLYVDCYVEREGVRICGSEVNAEIKAAIMEIDQMNAEIDCKINELKCNNYANVPN